MVLLCKGLPQDRLDFNGVTINEAVNNIPAQKATGSKTANQMMITFILIIHGYRYVDEVKLFVKQIDGVEGVKGDYCNASRLEVTGKVDPFKIQEMVERETKKKVELILPSSQMGDIDKNQGTEEKLKKGNKIYKNIISNKKTKESQLVLKIKLCCDSCNQKLIKNLKMKGLETIIMDVEKSLVTVKSSVDLTELRSYFKDELNKDVEIIDPAEVAFPSKREKSTIYKKVDDKAAHKKHRGSTTAFDLESRGGKKEGKDKDDHNNGEKNNCGGRETKPNEFPIDAAGKERSRDSGGSSSRKKDKYRDGMRNVNAEIYNDNMYHGYFCALTPAPDLEEAHQFFSDENTHSCFIM